MSVTKKITIFSGGRGNKNLIEALKSNSSLELSILINGFDDGLSTGRLRKYVGNILGPSDFRKNASYVATNSLLNKFFDYRLPVNIKRDLFGDFIDNLCRKNFKAAYSIIGYKGDYFELSDQVISIFKNFWNYDVNKEHLSKFNYSDCALGNIFFVSLYLEKNNFQDTIDDYCNFLGVPSNIRLINIDDGVSLKLCAITSEGELLIDEASIVENKFLGKILEFFLVPFNIDLTCINKVPFSKKISILNELSVKPKLSVMAKKALLNCDLLIYGSGTQFSSLLPSYYICGDFIKSLPLKNKVYISNLSFDNDIKLETISSLVDRTLSYLGDPLNCCSTIDYAITLNEYKNDNLKWFANSVFAPNKYKNINIIKDQNLCGVDGKHNGTILLSLLDKLS